MHSNANITFQQQETRDLLDAVVSIQPRVSSAGGGGANSTDAIAAALCADILHQMPEDLSLEEAAPGLFDCSSSDSKLNSLSVVLGQEVERFRRLSGVMRSSLAQLQAAIKGLVVMSEPLEAAYNALLSNEVSTRVRVCVDRQGTGNGSSVCVCLPAGRCRPEHAGVYGGGGGWHHERHPRLGGRGFVQIAALFK